MIVVLTAIARMLNLTQPRYRHDPRPDAWRVVVTPTGEPAGRHRATA